LLPDFPKTRKEISEQLLLRLRLQVQEKSVFGRIPRQVQQHEGGRQFSYEQILEHGKRIVTEEHEQALIPIQFEREEIPKLIGDRLIRKLDQLAEAMATHTSQLGFRKMEEACRVAGTAFDAGGKPFTKEMFLQFEEARDWSFDPRTHEQLGNYVAHPDTAKRMHDLWQLWEQDREFMKKFNDLKTRKFEAWRDRESCRKLVT
jgi:hypothetical protein